MNNHDVVKKLIGKIKPIGETNEDNQRFENLIQMCNLVENLLLDIDEVAAIKGHQEYSIVRSVDVATKFLLIKVEEYTKLK